MQLQTKNFQIEHIFSIESAEDLLRTFREKERPKVILPVGLPFPMNVRSYFTWKEPSGVYTYLVFKMPNWDMARGVAFKKASAGGEAVGGLCSWCHSYGTSEDIAMLSVSMSPNVSHSYLVCQDLRCIEKIEENCMRAGKDPEKHIADLYFKIQKLFENISGYKFE